MRERSNHRFSFGLSMSWVSRELPSSSLGRCWEALGGLLALLGARGGLVAVGKLSWAVSEPFCAVSETSWAVPRPSWGSLGGPGERYRGFA